MRITAQTFILLAFLLLGAGSVYPQSNTKIGLTTGAISFYPKANYLESNNSNSMGNGFGYSLGLFIETHWKPKIHPVIELNFSSLMSDIHLEKVFEQVGSYGGYGSYGSQVISQDLKNEPFNSISLSLGAKFFLVKKFFIYPAFELAGSCKKQVNFDELKNHFDEWMTTNHFLLKEKNTHRIVSNTKLGIGFNLNKADLILEYSHGYDWQLSVYDYYIPLGLAKKDRYLQLKIQLPIIKKGWDKGLKN